MVKEKERNNRHRAVAALFQRPRNACFAEQVELARAASLGVRSEIGDTLECTLNDELKKLSHATLTAKQGVVRFVEGVLDGFSFRVVCPRTKRPARLSVEPGPEPLSGRFRFEVADVDGRWRTTHRSVHLPKLSLIPAEQTVPRAGSLRG